MTTQIQQISESRKKLASVNEGHSTRFIQEFLGHRDIRHTGKYTKVNSKRFSGIK
ncbi:tyrosine-type recombinase/integrase [Nostoc sp.]|uniref:tyrosine-type recombinase/integrase n=1 Tax=Nostoc sp. TaxID=1180 RepID=UPI002FF65CD3